MLSIQRKTKGWQIAGWLAVAAILLMSGFYFGGRSGDNPTIYRNDFNVYYHAAAEVRAIGDPYKTSLTDWTPYIYPPLLAELLIPLSTLPLKTSAYFWFLINATLLIFAVILTSRMLVSDSRLENSDEADDTRTTTPERTTVPRILVIGGALVLVGRFALDSFSLGQVNPIVASLIVIHVYLFCRNRRVAAALALAAAASIKLSPLVLIAYHLAKKRLKFSVACAMIFVVLNLLSFAVLGTKARTSFEVFWSRTIRNGQGYDLAYSGNQSLRGAVARIEASVESSSLNSVASIETGERRPTSPASALIAVLLLLGAAFSVWRRAGPLNPSGPQDSDLSSSREASDIAPFVCLAVLLSPLAWKAHFVTMLLPVAVLIADALRFRAKGRTLLDENAKSGVALSYSRFIVATLIGVMWVIPSPNVAGLRIAEWSDRHSVVFAGGLVLFIVLLVMRFRAKETEAAQ